jgi:predicted transcriptional regulator
MVAKKAGGKLTRSETVTVRLDPKLRYLADLAARKQRRTLSSYIEWAIEESLSSTIMKYNGPHEYTLAAVSLELWDVDEADRFVKLAIEYPDLLTHEEQVLWKLVRENGTLWKGHYDSEWVWNVDSASIIYERLREHWDKFLAVARGEENASILPTWEKKEVDFDPDSEIPF